MSAKSTIRCPHCAALVEKYGEGYHRVYPFENSSRVRCEMCGGIFDGDKWVYRCESCKAEVDPGGLAGLFVPHKCKPCEKALADRERANGNVCLMCHAPRSRCCC
jgi:DNA-directed RNA polymerase subunit RPC12/RpoP